MVNDKPASRAPAQRMLGRRSMIKSRIQYSLIAFLPLSLLTNQIRRRNDTKYFSATFKLNLKDWPRVKGPADFSLVERITLCAK